MEQAIWLAKQSLHGLTYVAWVTIKHIPKIINHLDITFEISELDCRKSNNNEWN